MKHFVLIQAPISYNLCTVPKSDSENVLISLFL